MAKESTLAFHTAMSFKSYDCTFKLISKLFEPKFGALRTKCKAIILNILAPLSVEQLHANL